MVKRFSPKLVDIGYVAGSRPLKIYVRVFRIGRGSVNVLNKTFTVRDYGDYLEMMSQLRMVFWSLYTKRFRRSD